jgi:hypothetical protein
MSGPTPGTWAFVTIDGDRMIRAPGESGALMCDTQYYPWCPDKDEDWRLMAAAPALLKVAKDMLRRVADENVIYGPDHVVTATRAAIAAATEAPK